MNLKLISKWQAGVALAALLALSPSQSALAGGCALQGQNKGDTNTWSSVNLQNWVELDYIPFRIYFPSGSAGPQTITVTFPHLIGTTPGFENLTGWNCYTPNVIFTSMPVLSAPASGTWSYTFTVQVLDNNPSEVRFLARLAAGAHINGGSSLKLDSTCGSVQIHKPAAGPGLPDLAIVKTGSTSVCQGGMISYTLTYTNNATTNTSVGVQLSDILPAWLTVDPNSLPTNADLVGNTIFWDLPDMPGHASGQVSFQAQVSYQTPLNLVLTNFAQILSSENDANMLNNSSTWNSTANCACTNASVTTPPASAAVCPGAPANFTVTAGGPGPFTYQWRKNGNNISGANGTSYSIASVSAADAGSYDVAVSNLCNGVISSAAILTLNQFAAITNGPSDKTVCAGGSATFTVSATGTGLTYQWYKGVSVLAGKTSSSLTLSNLTVADAGTYNVVVHGTCGNSVTNGANLTVNQGVVVTSPPVSLTNCAGTTASFSITATGAGLAYQWYKGAGLMAGQTGSTLTLNNISAADAAVYRVVVSGTCGSAVTNSASLTVNALLSVSVVPASTTNCAGTTANFTVAATGSGLSYKWYKDGNLLPGQTSGTLSLNNVSSTDAGIYTAVASGICGNAATNSAVLAVNDNVAVSSGPADVTKCPGSSASFSVSATGTSLNYQWYKGASPLSGQTSSSLTLNSVSAADAGSYSVTVSGVCGSPITRSATLTVNEQVAVTTVPVSLTNCPGTTALFSIVATGTSLSYQWYRSTNALTVETNSSLTLTNISAADADTYSVVVSGACGNPVTNSATLTVNENVAVSSGPSDQTLCAGDSASFSVSATGTGLSYQWLHDGSPIAGATDSSLIIASAQPGDAGRYDAVVSGSCGVAQTNGAMLVVNTPVAISAMSADQTICAGASVGFSVGATGTGLTYQWLHDGSPIPGATDGAINISAAQPGDAGRYDVIISGTCGSAQAAGASLVVNLPVSIGGSINDQTVCAGANTSFSVNASGTSLSFQWFKGGNALPGQTGSTLALNNVSTTDAGNYSVTVSGICGSSLSSSANLTVNQNVAMTTGPANVTACPGANASFSVSATGTSLSYQWSKDGNPLAAQTGSTLTLNNVSSTDAGSYSVSVSGVCGNPVTGSATLTVNDSMMVSSVPVNSTNCPGTDASFSVSASGTGVAYQWYRDTNALVGEISSTLTLTNVTAADADTYSVVVSGACGTPITNSAVLVVNENVTVSTAPADLTVCAGDNASFSVSASGTGLSYQWLHNGTAMGGATDSSLNIASAQSADAGQYTVIVSGTCGGPQTNSATLTVNSPVLVSSAPANATVCAGANASFSVSATGTGLSYQWFRGASALPGMTDSSLNLNNLSAADAGSYSVTVSGVCGIPITSSATLTVNENVLVSSASANVTTCPGTTASFSVNASGTSLSYQWFKGANALAGQTSPSLILNNVSASDAGTYSVTVSGVCGAPISSTATLTVNENVAVATGPTNVTTCAGNSAIFSVNATGTSLSYQWFKGASPLAGQTGSSLTLNNVSASDAGSYSVTVSGVCGNPITSSATLTVNENVAVATGPTNVTTCAGNSAIFSVNATGTSLSYQWFKGATPLAGQTGSSLALNNVGTSDAGTYSVTVSGVCGSPITSSATLTVNENVAVAVGPAHVTTCSGTSASFSVTAFGTGLNYQWFKGASPLAGQTGSNLTLNNVSASDAGTYSVTVSGVCGNPITSSATLTVNDNVAIASGPANVTTCAGTSANFSVSASGTSLSYQWSKGASPLAGQTGTSLALNNVSASDAGTYSVTVSGVCGNPITSSATLTVNDNLLVSRAPTSLTNCPGTDASFTLSATGTGLSYQWYKGTNVLSAETASSLTLTNVTAADASDYTVVVSGACGSSITNTATLTVNENVTIASSPVDQTVCAGDSASFSVNATGTSLSYQWLQNGTTLTGATSSNLVLPSAQAADAGRYDVIVSGVCGNSLTNSAMLTVNARVMVMAGPMPQTVCAGSSASFNVMATGTDLSYQWYKGASALQGQIGSSLTLNNVQAADAGDYNVVVNGTCGSIVTSAAHLTVNENLVVSSAPISLTNCPGTTASFNVAATGTGLSYQWFKGAAPLSGQTGSSLTINNVSAADAGSYSVTVSGVCGNSISSSATLTVNQNVAVANGPQNQTVCPGANANFSVSATGTALTYQWFKGASALAGQTGSSLSLNNVSANDAGAYSVTISGTCGNSISSSATLAVNDSVVISSAPVSLTNCPGSTANFSVTAAGTSLAYQWYRGTNVLDGETSSSLILTNVSASDADSYSVVVSGSCGAPSTNSAKLTVNSEIEIATAPVDMAVCPGWYANFNVLATGTGLTYQWLHNGSPVSGATGSSLNLSGVQAADAGRYDVVVSGTCGAPQTVGANLIVNAPVMVMSGPMPQAVCPGNSATFNVWATGTDLFYQWYKGAAALGGQTDSSLVLNNVTAADAGSYSVVVSGVCGSMVTTPANLTVNENVNVANGPANQTVCAGSSASFSVSATGTGLSYQWFKGASPLARQTSSSLVLNNVSSADAGTYSVTVSGACGNSVSSSATLTVNENVTVAVGPAHVTTCPGTSPSFSVTAFGTGLNYQWFKGASPLAGQTGSSLTLNNVSASDAGSYSVTVSGTCGNSISKSATLTVNDNVAIASAPANQTVCAGSGANFNVSATGTGLSYQWFKGASPLAGQTSSSLSLNNVSSADAGNYSVTVSSTCGNSISSSATLTVNQNVAIATGVANVTTCPGTTANFNVSATGTGLSYQWFKGASPLAGQTGSSLSLNNVSATDAGNYSVTVSGTCGNSLTSSATLTVNENVAVATAPVSLTNCPGTTAMFSVAATGTGLSYQWYKNSSVLLVQTGSSLELDNLSAVDAATYTVVVSGACGASITNSATLTVNDPVAVASGPASVTTCPGSSISFNVTATGTGLSYQWYKGITVIAGQTSSSALAGQTAPTLVLNNLTAGDAGIYSVVVNGACGASVTNTANLTVNQPVAVSSAPASVTACPGTTASFSVGATGTSLVYQWYKGATTLAGQTGNSLTLNNITSADAGSYSVTVNGACGNSITTAANLIVNEAVAVSSGPASVTTCPGTSANFNVIASGTGLTYQWFKGATPLAGQTGNSLSLNNVSSTDAGSYSVTVSGTCGNSISSSANLTVNETVAVSSAPVSITNCSGTTASFAVAAIGTGLSYQWYKGATPLAGQTGNSLSLNNVSAADAGSYSVTVSATCGNSITSGANLSVNQNVVVSSAPANVTTCPGTTANFNVTATGTSLSYQWFKGATALAGQTGSSLTLNNVSATDAGNYSVTVSGTCGSTTSAATLTVNSTITATTLSSISACPGTSASFATVATGTAPITYQWQKNGSAILGQTGASLTLSNVTSSDAAIYTVLVNSGCGSTSQSAVLSVNTNVSASALTSLTRNPGATATFSTVATGTGPFSFVWKKNGSVLAGRTTSSITLSNLTSADAGNYTVEVSGACSTASQTAALIINAAPTVSIVNPTNGATFVFPQGVPILVNANDTDGTIAKVEIFQGNTRLADLYVAPYAFFWTNVPVGAYQLTARATDNSGLTATSSVVNITVLDHAPVAGGPITLNRQNGLFEQTVTITNPSAYTFKAVRLWIQNLSAETKVWNATGTNNGIAYIDYNLPIAGGSSASLLVQYYVPSRITPNPTFLVQVLSSDYGQSKYAIAAPMIDSCTKLPNGSIQLQFEANANATYGIQYCTSLGGTWKTANAVLSGTGGTVTFTDAGAPVTESHPSTVNSRFYRLFIISQ